MLNEISFQRKKEFNTYSQPIQSEQTKTIYDFVLRQDNQIKLLEKEINSLKNELIIISSKFPLLEQKSDDQITKSELNFLIPTIPTKEEIKAMIKIELDKNETIKILPDIKKEIIHLKKDNSDRDNKISLINTQITSIQGSLDKIPIESSQNNPKSIENISMINSLEKKTFSNMTQLKQQIEQYIIKTNKKLTDIDNDFDRLIESLKSQFQSVNEMITQFDETKVNIKDLPKYVQEHSYRSLGNTPSLSIFPQNINTSNNLFDNFKFHTIDPNIQKNQHISQMPSLVFDNIGHNSNNLSQSSAKFMKQELITLKNEINTDFEKINNKILSELQNQANDIKQLYTELHTSNTLNCIPSNMSNQSENDYTRLQNIIYQIDQEVSKKANIEQLNYALEAQAKINDAFCSANKMARWSWGDEGIVNDNGIIIWTIQNINTSLDVFSWETDSETIYVNIKGIYKVSAGLLCNGEKEKKIFININNETVITSEGKKDEEDGIISIEKFLALGDEAKIQIGVLTEKNNKINKEDDIKLNINNECNAEAFFEIQKII